MSTLFNTRFALIQAPMAGVQDAFLASAVCNAGGLGSLPCAMFSNEQLLNQLHTLVNSTEHPYNLNFFCHTPENYTMAQKNRWHSLLTPYFDEYGVDESKIGMNASRKPIDDEIIDLIAPFKPPVVSFHFGLPKPHMVNKIKGWGAKVISSATTVDEAKWLVDHGADAVIAQGLEAGGHRGHFLKNDVSLQCGVKHLVEQCVAQLSIPVIAAGGITTPEGVGELQALGISAVQVGSAYLLCDEARTSSLHKAALNKFAQNDTALTSVFSGRAARGICNRAMTELAEHSIHVPPFPFASIAMTALRTEAEALGDSDFSPLWCGQNFIARPNLNAEQVTMLLMQGWR